MISRHLESFRKATSLHQGLKNSAFSVVEYLANPILVFLSTPFLVRRLGADQYGIWLLVLALTGTIGLVNVGLGDSVIRYVAGYRGRGDSGGAIRVVRSTLGLSLTFGIAVIAANLWLAPVFIGAAFKVDPRLHDLAIASIRAGSVVLAVRFVEAVFLSTLRGYERYDVLAKVSVPTKAAGILTSVGLAWAGYHVSALLIGTAVVGAVGVVIEAVICQRVLGSGPLWPRLQLATVKEIFSFWFFGWVNGIGSLLTSRADGLVIAHILGTTMLTPYGICLQLAQQVQALISPAVAVIFPMVSSGRLVTGDRDLGKVARWTAVLNAGVSLALAAPLFFLAHWILRWWMGRTFADENYVLLQILAVAFFIMSLNTANYFFLMGTGKIRFVTVTSITGSVIALACAIPLIHLWGIRGAAVSRIIYAVLTGIAMTAQLMRTLERSRHAEEKASDATALAGIGG